MYKRQIFCNPTDELVELISKTEYKNTTWYNAICKGCLLYTSEKAIQLDPTKTDLYKNISSAYEQKNDYKKAISAYQKYYTSLDKEHQTPDLQFQFGRLYYGAGTVSYTHLKRPREPLL